MVDVWEEMFGIDIEEGPQIGLVDISEVNTLEHFRAFRTGEQIFWIDVLFQKEGIWFDMSLVNLDDPKKHSDSNFEVLQTWIDQIMNGQISLDGRRKYQ